MADWRESYIGLQQQEMLDKLLEQKERQQRMANAQYVMRLSKMNPETMGGYLAGQLLGDSINRWLNREGKDNPYPFTESQQQLHDIMPTAVGIVQGNPQAVRDVINGGAGLLGNFIGNGTNAAQNALGNVMQNIDKAGLGNNLASIAVGNVGEGLSGVMDKFGQVIGDAGKGLGEKIPWEDLFKNMWGGNS